LPTRRAPIIVDIFWEAARVGASGSIAAYWFFQVPNFILAALMYTLLGRALLGLIVGPASSNYIWRFFCLITDPFIALITPLTPKATAPAVIWLLGVAWLFWLRVGLLYLFLLLGAFQRGGGAP
jgi:hypothetical protein